MSTATRVQPITDSDKHLDRDKTGGVLRQTRLTNNQDSALSVFTHEADGTLRHFYTSHPWLDDDVNERGIDLLQPVYNMLDLTPQGRGSWYASLDYGTWMDWPVRR